MKKLLFILPIVTLLAVSCGSSQQPTPVKMAQTSNSISNENTSITLLKIDVSGSTNTLPYTINVYTNGSANVMIKNKVTKSFPSGTIDAMNLKDLLKSVADVSLLTSGTTCAKSASFGTYTKITYNGKTSGDISCRSGVNWPQVGYDLSDFVNQIKQQFNIQGLIIMK